MDADLCTIPGIPVMAQMLKEVVPFAHSQEGLDHWRQQTLDPAVPETLTLKPPGPSVSAC